MKSGAATPEEIANLKDLLMDPDSERDLHTLRAVYAIPRLEEQQIRDLSPPAGFYEKPLEKKLHKIDIPKKDNLVDEIFNRAVEGQARIYFSTLNITEAKEAMNNFLFNNPDYKRKLIERAEALADQKIAKYQANNAALSAARKAAAGIELTQARPPLEEINTKRQKPLPNSITRSSSL